jgi:hypothetical protein
MEGVVKRPEINISSPERWARVGVGVAALALSVTLLTGGGGSLQSFLAGLLGLSGLDLAVTGALGHGPLYRRLGHVPSCLGRTQP